MPTGPMTLSRFSLFSHLFKPMPGDSRGSTITLGAAARDPKGRATLVIPRIPRLSTAWGRTSKRDLHEHADRRHRRDLGSTVGRSDPDRPTSGPCRGLVGALLHNEDREPAASAGEGC